MKARKFEVRTPVSLVLPGTSLLFLVSMFGLLKQAVITPEGSFSLAEVAG